MRNFSSEPPVMPRLPAGGAGDLRGGVLLSCGLRCGMRASRRWRQLGVRMACVTGRDRLVAGGPVAGDRPGVRTDRPRRDETPRRHGGGRRARIPVVPAPGTDQGAAPAPSQAARPWNVTAGPAGCSSELPGGQARPLSPRLPGRHVPAPARKLTFSRPSVTFTSRANPSLVLAQLPDGTVMELCWPARCGSGRSAERREPEPAPRRYLRSSAVVRRWRGRPCQAAQR
jgi:hypothetical protein